MSGIMTLFHLAIGGVSGASASVIGYQLSKYSLYHLTTLNKFGLVMLPQIHIVQQLKATQRS